MRIYNTFFGKLPYTRIAMTQQPAGFFGQAWPTLVLCPTSLLSYNAARSTIGYPRGTDNFWRYVAPHEVSHNGGVMSSAGTLPRSMDE